MLLRAPCAVAPCSWRAPRRSRRCRCAPVGRRRMMPPCLCTRGTPCSRRCALRRAGLRSTRRTPVCRAAEWLSTCPSSLLPSLPASCASTSQRRARAPTAPCCGRAASVRPRRWCRLRPSRPKQFFSSCGCY